MKSQLAAAFAGLLLAAAWLCAVPIARADVTLDVRTDRTSMTLDDVLTLQVTINSQGGDAPQVQIPQPDGFQIVSQQVQRPMQFSFGFGQQAMVQSSIIYIFGLQPIRTGTLTLKPVRVELDGKVKSSRPIQITVTAGRGQQAPPAQASPQGGAAPDTATPPQGQPQSQSSQGSGVEIDPIAFVRTVVDKPEPFEGEQVTATVYLYLRERLQSTPNVETEPTTDGLWVQDLLPPGHTLQPARQVVGDAIYTVYVLKRFAGFPLRSGDITIGPMTLVIDTSSLFDIFAPDRARPNLKRSSQPVTLHVKPLPTAGRPPGDVAVGRYKLEAKLDRTQAATGDAVTLTATVQGQGNIRGVKLQTPSAPGVEVLAPETKDLIESPNDLAGGTREFRWLIVARTPGHVELPEVALDVFDPSTQRYEHLHSGKLALEVVGQALAKPDAQAQSAQPAKEAVPSESKPAPEAQSWAPIRTQSRLRRGHVELVDRPWFAYALAAPGLLWLSVVSLAAARRRAAARANTGSGRLVKQAEQRLRNAETAAGEGAATRFFAEASAALVTLLEARLDEAPSGFTQRELHARLLARGMPDALAAETIALLEEAERARFGGAAGGANAGELERKLTSVRALYARLQAFTPRAKEAA